MVITKKGSFLPERQCAITNGPNKYELQALVFDKDKPALQFAIVTINGSLKMSERFFVNIAIIGPEEGTKECFFGTMGISNSQGEVETRAFFYDTRSRKGHVCERGYLWRYAK